MLTINADTKIVQKSDIGVTDIDGEKAMINLEKGQYFMINNIGSRIWDIINKQCCVKEIVSKLISEYEIDEATCERNIIEFLERLNDAELINIK